MVKRANDQKLRCSTIRWLKGKAVLAQIALTDSAAPVRRTAIRRLVEKTDVFLGSEILEIIATEATGEDDPDRAVESFNNQISLFEIATETRGTCAVDRLTDQNLLLDIALIHKDMEEDRSINYGPMFGRNADYVMVDLNETIRHVAAKRLNDPHLLRELASKSSDKDVVGVAVSKLAYNSSLLEEVADSECFYFHEFRCAQTIAISLVDNQGVLESISSNVMYPKKVRCCAIERLNNEVTLRMLLKEEDRTHQLCPFDSSIISKSAEKRLKEINQL